MPILSGLLLALFNFLVNVFLKFFDVRKAWALAMVVISLGLLAALYMSFVSCINSCAGERVWWQVWQRAAHGRRPDLQ